MGALVGIVAKFLGGCLVLSMLLLLMFQQRPDRLLLRYVGWGLVTTVVVTFVMVPVCSVPLGVLWTPALFLMPALVAPATLVALPIVGRLITGDNTRWVLLTLVGLLVGVLSPALMIAIMPPELAGSGLSANLLTAIGVLVGGVAGLIAGPVYGLLTTDLSFTSRSDSAGGRNVPP